MLEDSYHMVTLDKERHVVVERTRAFIDRVATIIRLASETASMTVIPQVA